MNLADILSPAQILSEMRAVDRWEAIEELIDHLVETGKIRSEDRGSISSVVRKRENSMSTGIGFGIGIPHASTDLIHEVVGAPARGTALVSSQQLLSLGHDLHLPSVGIVHDLHPVRRLRHFR